MYRPVLLICTTNIRHLFKPDNILISQSGSFIISDFGISKQLRNTLRRSVGHLDMSGSVAYMGPERFSKNSMPIKASDIWSLGATIYELAVGELPFCGMGGSMQQKGAEIPELPEDYSDTINMVMMSCMAKDTWDRPTAHQLEDFAGRVLAGESPKITWKTPLPEGSASPNPPKQTAESGVQQEAVPPPSPYNTTNQNTKAISPAWWFAVIFCGLITGFLINLFL